MDFEREMRFGARRSGNRNDPNDIGCELDPVDFSKINLKPYNKNFYVPKPKKDKEIVDEYRKKHDIQIKYTPNGVVPDVILNK